MFDERSGLLFLRLLRQQWQGASASRRCSGHVSSGSERAVSTCQQTPMAAAAVTRKRAGVSWSSCPGPRTSKGTRKIASKKTQDADERKNPPLLKRPYTHHRRRRAIVAPPPGRDIHSTSAAAPQPAVPKMTTNHHWSAVQVPKLTCGGVF